jgi:hypothetical protein
MTILIGADPELFVKDNKTGLISSSIGLIGGSKNKPLPVDKGALQEDNVLAEFNIDPAATEDEFVGNILAVTAQLDELLGALGFSTECRASYYYDEGALEAYGKQALVFGCQPDKNAWTGAMQKVPDAGNLRTAGGHIHFGIDGLSKKEKFGLIQSCDVHMGLPSVFMDEDVDRRKVYGGAGSFRLKRYGAEYRALSNFWLQDEDTLRWVYRAALEAADHRNTDYTAYAGDIQQAINTGNRGLAGELIKELGVKYAA